MATFGSSGIFEQDDTEPWTTITRTSGTAFARLTDFRLNYQMGTPGVGDRRAHARLAGAGYRLQHPLRGGNMRNLVETWLRYMRRPNGAGA